MPRAASSRGSTCARTAYFCGPKMETCATPGVVEMRWARSVSAYSFTSESRSVGERTARKSTGESAGFTFLYDGGLGMSRGSRRAAAAMALCTSCAAASMLRLRLKTMVMFVRPSALVEVIESMPAMVLNCRSSGVATAAAMVSGLAPRRLAETWMVGKSTFGRSLTGSPRKAKSPKPRMASMTSVVITGRRMKGSEMFIEAASPPRASPALSRRGRGGVGRW